VLALARGRGWPHCGTGSPRLAGGVRAGATDDHGMILVMRHRARAARIAKAAEGRLQTWRDRPPGPGPSRRRGFNLQLAAFSGRPAWGCCREHHWHDGTFKFGGGRSWRGRVLLGLPRGRSPKALKTGLVVAQAHQKAACHQANARR
jgi:hypothetical protein